MTDRYAVIGNPIDHSKSPQLQMAFARQTGQDIVYERILGARDRFSQHIEEFRSQGGKGLNITVPFKVEAFDLAGERTPRSRMAGATNTYLFRDNGEILGDNTDGVGIVRDIAGNLGHDFKNRRILILGAGGAVRGIILPILEEQPREIVIANRTPSTAQELAEVFSPFAGKTEISGGDFAGTRGHFDIIINGTSSSLSSQTLPLNRDIWSSESLAYDMVYQNRPTPFMDLARACGCGKISDGLGMLVEQGAESFFLWRGIRPDTAAVIRMLRTQ